MRSDVMGAGVVLLIVLGLGAGGAIWVSNWNECRESFSWLYCFNQWVLR